MKLSIYASADDAGNFHIERLHHGGGLGNLERHKLEGNKRSIIRILEFAFYGAAGSNDSDIRA